MRTAPLALGVAALALASAGRARADLQEPPQIEVRGCEVASDVEAAIRLELTTGKAAVVRLTVVCVDEAQALVVAFPDGGGAPRVREVALSDVPGEARTRTLALAAAELARDREAPPVAPEPTAPTEPAPPAAAPAPSVASAPPLPVRSAERAPSGVTPDRGGRSSPPERLAAPPSVGAALHTRLYPLGGATLIGPQVGFDAALSASWPLRLQAGGDLGLAEERVAAGDLALTSLAGWVSVAWRTTGDSVRLDIGPRVDFGGASLRGSAKAPTITEASAVSPTLWAGLAVAAQVDVARPLSAVVGLDAGAALVGLEGRVDDRALLSLVGPSLGLQVGVAWAP